MEAVTIIGTGSAVPDNSVTNEMLESFFGESLSLISEQIGIRHRYWSVNLNTGELIETNTGLAAAAARRALEDAKCTPEEVDLIIMTTMTPDYFNPGSAAFVQEQLNIHGCKVLDLRAGCYGMAQAICTAVQYIKTGFVRTVLTIGCETNSPHLVKLFKPNGALNRRTDGRLKRKARLSLAMAGDGAGSLILRGSEDTEGGGILGCYMVSDGVGRRPGIWVKIGGSLKPFCDEALEDPEDWYEHDYQLIAKHGPAMLKNALLETLIRTNLRLEEVACIVPPQATTADYLLAGDLADIYPLVKDKLYFNLERFANTGSASIYIALDEARRNGVIKKDDIVLLLPSEATKWFYGGVAIQWSLRY